MFIFYNIYLHTISPKNNSMHLSTLDKGYGNMEGVKVTLFFNFLESFQLRK